MQKVKHIPPIPSYSEGKTPQSVKTSTPLDKVVWKPYNENPPRNEVRIY
jgi:hypothetical protein